MSEIIWKVTRVIIWKQKLQKSVIEEKVIANHFLKLHYVKLHLRTTDFPQICNFLFQFNSF